VLNRKAYKGVIRILNKIKMKNKLIAAALAGGITLTGITMTSNNSLDSEIGDTEHLIAYHGEEDLKPRLNDLKSRKDNDAGFYVGLSLLILGSCGLALNRSQYAGETQ
jgi:hypothetical protein